MPFHSVIVYKGMLDEICKVKGYYQFQQVPTIAASFSQVLQWLQAGQHVPQPVEFQHARAVRVPRPLQLQPPRLLPSAAPFPSRVRSLALRGNNESLPHDCSVNNTMLCQFYNRQNSCTSVMKKKYSIEHKIDK